MCSAYINLFEIWLYVFTYYIYIKGERERFLAIKNNVRSMYCNPTKLERFSKSGEFTLEAMESEFNFRVNPRIS